jgi:hypothetical protein
VEITAIVSRILVVVQTDTDAVKSVSVLLRRHSIKWNVEKLTLVGPIIIVIVSSAIKIV